MHCSGRPGPRPATPSQWSCRGGVLEHRCVREVSFILEGNEKSMPVTYQGPMPDNMAEGKEIVVEGVLQPNGELKGETIITKCASKYASEDAARDAKPAQRCLEPIR